MLSEGRSFATRPARVLLAFLPFLVASGAISGCASPGAPKPPSLHVPQPVKDLQVTRSGDSVQIRFSLPTETTDGLSLRGGLLHATVCRGAAPASACTPVQLAQAASPLRASRSGAPPKVVAWQDSLPHEFTIGSARPLVYRVELRSDAGRSAGPSAPAYVAAGAAPPTVEDFVAQGTRPGILLRWTPQPRGGEVLLERTQVDPPPDAPHKAPERKLGKGAPSTSRAGSRSAPRSDDATVWLQAEPGNMAASRTIDGTVTEDIRYRYIAVRRTVDQVGGRTLELRSAPSTPVEITWRDIYPPASPEGLTAVGFSNAATVAQASPSYAVDLIWQPVNDPRVTGYIVSRVAVSPDGTAQGAPQRLTAEPVTAPAFHDVTALGDRRYRYDVSAVDARGNTSVPATTVVRAAGR